MTDSEFVAQWEDPQNRRVVSFASKGYRGLLSEDEIKSCQMIALWKTLEGYNPELCAFSTYLIKMVKWEILKNITENANWPLTGLDHEILSDDMFESTIEMEECLEKLPSDLSKVIKQRFFEKLTLHEIGAKNGYTHEAARNKINKALNLLKRVVPRF